MWICIVIAAIFAAAWLVFRSAAEDVKQDY